MMIMTTRDTSSIYQDFHRGAIAGATAWVVYGVVECLFASILPWIIKPGFQYVPLHWGLTCLLLLVVYPVIGLILGGLSGLILSFAVTRIPFFQKRPIDLLLFVTVTLSLLLAYIINFIYNLGSLGLALLPPVSISALLIFALGLSVGSGVWFSRLRFLTNPCSVSVLLLGLPWINRELVGNFPLIVKAGASLAYPAIVLAIAFFLQKFSRSWRIGRSTDPTLTLSARSLLPLAAMVLVVLGISLLLKQQPLIAPQNIKSSVAPANAPNVLLIVMDTVRGDHLSLYGYKRDTTPNLRKLAEKATLYTRAIAPSDMTLPTHASIFTGLYGTSHGAHYEGPNLPEARPLDKNFLTLAEILSGKGYFTGAVVANTAYLHHDFGLNKGFQHYDQRCAVPLLGPAEFYATRYFYIRKTIRDILTHFLRPPLFDQRFRRAEEINDSVFAYFEKSRNHNAPFFLFVNYMDAHEPYIPPPPFDKYYSDKQATFTLANYFKMQEYIMQLERNITDEEYEHFLAQYDGGIAYIDYHLGELIKFLKQRGLYENTLIIITSDHGEVFGNRSLIGHGSSVYQDQVHVPLVIKFPKSNEKMVIDNLVGIIDLMPTILEVSGYEVPGYVHGKSLLKLEKDDTRVVLSESFPNPTYIKWHSRFNRYERAIFSKHFKFISSSAGKRELYNLAEDPNESDNLYNPDDYTSKELESRLNQWLALAAASVRKYDSDIKLDQDTLNRLKSLGYAR